MDIKNVTLKLGDKDVKAFLNGVQVYPSSQPVQTIMDFNITSNDLTLDLPFKSGDVDYSGTINWGDGTTSPIIPFASHTYSSPGLYTVKVTGFILAFQFYNQLEDDLDKLVDIKQWGDVILLPSAFRESTPNANYTFSATDIPILTSDASFMFQNAISFNEDISSWDYSPVGDLTNFMTGKTSSDYSSANYDALLVKWSADASQGGLQNVVGQTGKTIDMGTIQYTSLGATARSLIIAKGWTISDGGLTL